MDQLCEISVLLSKDRFTALLPTSRRGKDVRIGPAENGIELDRTAGQKSAHNRCDWNGSSAKKQMQLIGHQRPRVTGHNPLLKEPGEPLKKILSASVIC